MEPGERKKKNMRMDENNLEGEGVESKNDRKGEEKRIQIQGNKIKEEKGKQGDDGKISRGEEETRRKGQKEKKRRGNHAKRRGGEEEKKRT